jgi:hypothetical protein
MDATFRLGWEIDYFIGAPHALAPRFLSSHLYRAGRQTPTA